MNNRFSRAAWLGLLALATAAQITFFRPRPEVRQLFREVFRSPPAGDDLEDVPVTQWAPRATDDNPLPRGTAIVPDDGGAIRAVVVYFETKWREPLKPLFDDFFHKLPVSAQLQVACADSASRAQFEELWGAEERRRGRPIVILNAARPLTMWARDRHIALQDPLGRLRVSLIPKMQSTAERTRLDELRIPQLRRQLGLIDRVGYLPYYLEGGNVAANGRNVFIGKNALAENEEVLPDDTQLGNEFESLFGRKLILVGDRRGNVPYSHLDMYLTPVSEHAVLLADLAEGASLLELEGGRMPLAALQPNREKQAELDEIAVELKRLGYAVQRMPAVIHARDNWMITYNNVLMERRDGKKTVYMPVYHLPILDNAAAAVYRRLGFEVLTIDASQLFRNGGALRCAVNVVLRDLAPPPRAYAKAAR